MNCRIIVLNYNGRQVLEKCLPSVVDAAARSRRKPRVTVLDNCSRDESRDYVGTFGAAVEWVDAPSNRILCSYNEIVRDTPEEAVILLNNDIRVDAGFVDPLLDALEADPSAFFAAPRTLSYDGRAYEGGRAKWEFKWGLPWGTAVFPGHEDRIDRPGMTMQTGFGAFRRKMFNELGGFDDLYLPGTVEDADLCFRAYVRGWKGEYRPDSTVYHMGQTSFKKAFGSDGIARMNRRNLYLFTWKNIRSPRLWAQHLLILPVRLVWDLVRGRWGLVLGWTDACRRAGEAAARRRADRSINGRSDREVFALSRSL